MPKEANMAGDLETGGKIFKVLPQVIFGIPTRIILGVIAVGFVIFGIYMTVSTSV
jgi:hypothetical protein